MPDLDELIADALGDQEDLGVTDVVITRRTAGARNPANPAAGTNPATASYSGRGFIERTGRFSDGTLVKEDSVLISVFGASITGKVGVEPGDTIALSGRTYKVSRVQSDSVEAVFECEAK